MNVFVTCIYNGLHDTSFGGRQNRDSRYLESLKTIAVSGEQIYCFTSTRDENSIQLFLHNNSIDNVSLIVVELNELPFHDEIQRIKNSNDQYKSDLYFTHRCLEMMWGKFTMMQYLITVHTLDNIFWIDAGLCHNDVISPKYQIPKEGVTSEKFNRQPLFDENIMVRLISFANNKVMVARHAVPHNKPIPENYNNVGYVDQYGIIGGLFGGDATRVSVALTESIVKIHKILAAHQLYSDEAVLSGVYADNPTLFKKFDFDTWYHEGWPTHFDSSKINFSNLFDIITSDH